MMLLHWLEGRNLIEEEDPNTFITKFNSNVKTLFTSDLIAEIHNALEMNDPVILAFGVFYVSVNFRRK